MVRQPRQLARERLAVAVALELGGVEAGHVVAPQRVEEVEHARAELGSGWRRRPCPPRPPRPAPPRPCPSWSVTAQVDRLLGERRGLGAPALRSDREGALGAA